MSNRRKVRLFGLSVALVTDAAGLKQLTGGTGEHVHMVLRCADERRPPRDALVARRTTVRCQDCRALCWYDPESALLPSLAEIVCVQCCMARGNRAKP